MESTTPHLPLRYAIVGFGKLGLLHAALTEGLAGSKIDFVIDKSNSMLTYFKTAVPTLKAYETLEDALSKHEKPDAVLISTPTQSHAELAQVYLQRDIPIFVEKPLTSHWNQVPALLKTWRKHKVPTMVGYMSRYQDTFRKAKKILDSGDLGKIQIVEAKMYIAQLFAQGKGWRYSKAESGGGVLITQNSHLIDMLSWLLGEIESVNGFTKRLYSSEVEDYFHGLAHFKSGATAYLDTSWSKRHHRTLSMDISIQGEWGTLDVNEDDVRLNIHEAHNSAREGLQVFRKPDIFEAVPFEVAGMHYTRQALEFMEAVRSHTDTSCNFESAAKSQAVIEAFYRSSENKGKEVLISDVWQEAT